MYRKKPRSWLKHLDFILWDVFCLHVAFVLAYFLRHGWENPYGTGLYLFLILMYTFVDVSVLIYKKTFKNILKRGTLKEFTETVKHVFRVEMLITFVLFALQVGGLTSRIIVALIGLFYVILSFIVRLLWKQFLMSRTISGAGDGLFIITTNDRIEGLSQTVLERYRSIYHMVGICIMDEDRKGETIANVPVVSNAEELSEYLLRNWIDEVFVCLPPGEDATQELINDLAVMGIVVHLELVNPYELYDTKQFVQQMGRHTVLTISMNHASTGQLILKRMIDILGGFVGCLVTIFLTVILGPIIYLKSPGPIFFSQTRIGKNGKPFKMYKFRSMYLDAEERKKELMDKNQMKDGFMFKLEADPRIIGCKIRPNGTVKKGIGNFIRDWSLDEFPQFFNVLKGDMSLVGTRPPTQDEWEKYSLKHRSRLAFKPGLTGFWQVSGRSDITDFDQVVALDRKYILEWSFGLDLKVIWKTFGAVMKKEGAR